MTKKRIQQEICIPDTAIDGFCYPFMKALLEKLKELEKKDRIFEEGLDKALSMGISSSRLTSIAQSVLDKICEQLGRNSVGPSATPTKITDIIDLSEEFLAIFEIKK
ncbi:MAG: hypothetical protein UR66_C0009G0041 [Candidatus Moranbacteria bacterium GW2011_GWE1_35_17]|nr:MAG: hypothetical protein UR66_C0009G0041 [Candidatus Moranbacteria bacterium GW2011_GWE1_35_17]KKP68148.1 MAG: hypothetical protein UR65_C0062G0004 [Candidatus Moranbacteria bacterium GW2011_GWE2_35_164]KKP82717.1 MAG: hypothetical protein UR82_C0034G0013 [Candidatus Moranbacteria bacterium GW2011_GWF1_35_5]KKP84061.1 MAG: hypothetical protein UR83_C0028G0017 [Candidatus Moranbacteria bacterium GW2011_GWF2_35_54]